MGSAEREPNDTPETANPVPRGERIGGNVSGGDRDVFAVEVNAGETLTFTVDRGAGEGRFLVGALDPNSRPVDLGFSEAGGTMTLNVSAEQAGTWYVFVAAAEPDAGGSYTLSVPGEEGGAGETTETPGEGTETTNEGTETTNQETETTNQGTETTNQGTETPGERADPANDVVGWEDGYWYDDPIDVDQSDGLTQTEIDAYLARSKARVERIRGAEFRKNVSVEILSREEYVNETRKQNRTGQLNSDRDVRTWYNQRYESTFIVGEDENAVDAVESGDESTVLGFYDPRNGRLVVISDRPETPVINNATLIHELTHALQDQRFGLQRIRQGVQTSDQSNAVLGLTEGEANYIEALYERRCANGTWDCVATPRGERPDRNGVNRGAFAIVYQPYSDGPVLVNELVQRGGWDAVDAAYRNPPTSTEQTIDPSAFPNERPADVLFGDLSAPLDLAQGPQNGWNLVTVDTLGESWIYSMFYYQGVAYNNTIVPPSDYETPDAGEFDTYDYTSVPSNGWGNDYFLPFRKGGDEGYIWVTKWDTARDAREFDEAYRQVLRGHGAERVDDRTWIIRNGPYADAFAVVRQGRSVTIVNAPTVAGLTDIYPGIRGQQSPESGTNASSAAPSTSGKLNARTVAARADATSARMNGTVGGDADAWNRVAPADRASIRP